MTPEWLNGALTPFVLMAGKQPHWNLQRILEGLIIAGITGSITLYGVQKQLEVDIANIRVSVAELKADARDTRNAIASRIDRVEDKVDAHLIKDKR